MIVISTISGKFINAEYIKYFDVQELEDKTHAVVAKMDDEPDPLVISIHETREIAILALDGIIY